MDKYKKLLNNSIILIIGNFGSKLISLFMVPLYTNVLTTSEYGSVDIIITTIGLLVPFLSLALGHAAIRLSIEVSTIDEEQRIYSNITNHGIIASILVLGISPVILKTQVFNELGVYFILLLILNLFNDLYSQFVRGIGLVKNYAVNGIIMTFITVTANIILLLVFDYGLEGYVLSLILATLVSNLYLLFSISKKISVIPKYQDMKLYESMLRFSIPIIPNTVMWWLINGSTRYFLLFFVGISGNGLFAVANKIPSIISMFTNIFMQAWQLSSFEEYNSKDKDAYFSTIFNGYSSLLFILGSGILLFLKPVLKVLVEDSFYESWTIIPFLIIAVIYQSFSGFLGTNYTASKNTRGTFTTSVYGGIVSIISSLIFIPMFGVVGAGLSSALSFISMFIFRVIDTRKYVVIKINKNTFISNNLIIVIQALILFIFDGWGLYFGQLLLFVLQVFVNKMLLNLAVSFVFKNFKIKKG